MAKLTVFQFGFESENIVMELLELGKKGFEQVVWSNGEYYILADNSFFEEEFSLSNHDIFSLLRKEKSEIITLENGQKVSFCSQDDELELLSIAE